ncbi:ryncolin-1-like [Argopecten irradians]|uniref:ryncolin-1-like n=1 Tax=Argopecten irradians TaxID=31199 RepID=UPI003718A6FC
MCSYFQRNRNPPGERYLSGDIRMCHFLPKGTTSGVYTITPSDLITTDVYCDMDTVGGGWTIIQNRFDGSQDFYQNWEAYKQGFGSPYGEYWIGNEDLYLLTSSGSYELRIEMGNAAGVSKFAKYSAFSVSSESANYKLEVFGYSGSADDSLVLHNTKQFSTFDRDNNEADDNCAVIYQGAWWYNHCHRSNLNGPYNPYAADNSKAMTWYGFESGQGFATLRTSKMMIRPR